jgi:hypothetical protein
MIYEAYVHFDIKFVFINIKYDCVVVVYAVLALEGSNNALDPGLHIKTLFNRFLISLSISNFTLQTV